MEGFQNLQCLYYFSMLKMGFCFYECQFSYVSGIFDEGFLFSVSEMYATFNCSAVYMAVWFENILLSAIAFNVQKNCISLV